MNKSNKALVEIIYPIVETTLNDKNNQVKLKKIMMDHFALHAERLSSYGPTEQMVFPDRTKNELYRIFDVTEKQLLDAKKHSSVIVDGHTMGYGVNLLMPMITRYYSIHNNREMVEMSVFFTALFIYPLLFSKYFKYTPVPNVMAYTINNLSGKFRLKQDGILETTLSDTAIGAYDLHSKGIDTGLDYSSMQYVLAIRTRLNALLKKIASEYYINHKHGNYLNLETESNEEDSYREAEATIYTLSNIVDKVTNELVIKGPNPRIVTLAAKTNQVSIRDTKTYMYAILTKGNLEQIRTMIESILVLYMDSGRNKLEDINSNKFLIFSLDVYKRSNLKDKEVAAIKNILNEWMDSTSQVKLTNNVGTMNNFRRAIYTYFVLAIQYIHAR